MRKIFAINIILLVMTDLLFAQYQYRVVGYYTMWGNLPVSSVKFDKLTYINHAFAWPTASGGITSSPTTIDTALIGATHRAGKKILISLGGATTSIYFPSVAADTALRRTFINNLVNYVVNNHYDGADFDWEGPSNSAEKSNDIALMKQTREAFNSINTTLLLTMAIGSSSYGGQWRNYDSLSLYVDWYNVMTYDLDQEYSNGKSGYNAALYPHTTSPTNQDYSIDQSMMYLHGTRFIPYSKLVLGVPFYGKYFLGAANINSLYTSALPVAYYQIMNLTSWTRIWDDTAKVPYLMNGSSVITYDDSMSIAFKCQYAKTKGLSGIMIWELSQDVIGQTQPLLDVVSNQLLTTVKDNDQLQNILVNKFTLYNNYPNPFNPTTTIRFYLPISSFMTLKVYDVLGREVATLAHEERSSGEGFVIFDASTYGISSGVYFYRMQAGMYSETKRLVLMK